MLQISSTVFCQQKKQSEIVIPNIGNTAWWSGVINQGHIMPLQDGYSADFTMSNYGNQVQPMLISNRGHLIWSEEPFEISLNNNTMNYPGAEPRGINITHQTNLIALSVPFCILFFFLGFQHTS